MGNNVKISNVKIEHGKTTFDIVVSLKNTFHGKGTILPGNNEGRLTNVMIDFGNFVCSGYADDVETALRSAFDGYFYRGVIGNTVQQFRQHKLI